MNRNARPCWSRRSASRLSTCAWVDRSSALHRLVQDDDLRVADQRPGDRDPLPLAAGELGRVPVDGVAGQADGLQRRTRPLQRLGRAVTPISRSGSTSVWPMVRAGLSEEYGSWKTTRRSAADGAALLERHRGDVLAVQLDGAGGRRLQAEHGLADRRLAGAGLADQPEGLARGDVEADAVDGRRGACGPCGRSRSGRRGRGPRAPGSRRRWRPAVAGGGRSSRSLQRSGAGSSAAGGSATTPAPGRSRRRRARRPR